MTQASDRLYSLAARDVMTRALITLRTDDTVGDAVKQLREHHVTGAPVVDEGERLVGILSISDLLAAEDDDEDEDAESEPRTTPLAHGRDTTTWDLFERSSALPEAHHAHTVAERMSSVVTSVTEDAPLVEVARAMCDGHWHRVPVVDGVGTLVGIVSSIDVLAAVVNAHDERT